MPSGTAKTTSDHRIEIVDDGHALNLFVDWPRSMTDLDSRIEEAARSQGFRAFLRSLRANTAENIVSSRKIPLPSPVKSESAIDKKISPIFVL